MTLYEIAALAGVSRGTVDRVLKGRGGVRPETERRVRRVLEESGYRPNKAGVALVRARRPVRLGVLLNSSGNPFFEQVIEGVRAAEREYADYGLGIELVQIAGYDPELQLAAIDELAGRGISGLAVTPMEDARVRSALARLYGEGMPTVFVNSDLADCPRICYVGCDYAASGRVAAHLLATAVQGGRLGILTGSDRMLGHRQRVEGFLEVWRAERPGVPIAGIRPCGDDDEVAYRETRQMLEQRITALYIATGGSGGALRAAREAGVTLAAVGQDELPATIAPVKSGELLGVVSQQPFEQGYRAVKLLFTAVIGGGLPEQPLQYTQLAIRMKYNIG